MQRSPRDSNSASSELALLTTLNSRMEAEVICSLLRADGLWARVVADDCGSVCPSQEFGLGVSILVRRVDLEQAERATGRRA